MNKSIAQHEDDLFFEDDSQELPPHDIVAYNESRSCADLYRMYQQGVLNIQPDFQREIVWNGPAQTRFIDSLIKQLPIPSLCFSLDYKTQRWQVIDGLQRMASIIRFLSGDPQWTLSQLNDIEPELSGKTAKDFLNRDTTLFKFYQRVENLTLPITVLRCDYSKKSHTQYLFTIFHRLNTGAVKLNNQEIRNCIFSGNFNDMLHELNRTPYWMKLNRMKSEKGYRYIKQEMILRFFSFYYRYENYNGRLAGFLNNYMNDMLNIDAQELIRKKELFQRTLTIVYEKIFDSKNISKIPISIMEALLVGIAKNIDKMEIESESEIKKKYSKMLSDEEFSDQKLSEGLSGKQRVIGRMNSAIEAFK